MGDDLSSRRFTRGDRQRYREKVRLCLDVFEQMLRSGQMAADTGMTGVELELNLVNDDGLPAFVNQKMLQALADPKFTTEIGRFNVEMNMPPVNIVGAQWGQVEQYLTESLRAAEASAYQKGARLAMVGILPTLMPEHLSGEWMSNVARYAALNNSILAARGEDFCLDIYGTERLAMYATSIGPEAACTSTQLHLQVAPELFANYWNAAQLFAAPQVALTANSPLLFGRKLWHETRIELFKQATDTRSQELQNQGVRPRVFFGERWITSIFDLFEENSEYFPALLPEITDEDPVAELEAGRAPQLHELRLHNGTVYRWNRPVYDVADGKPHVRVENRVMAAGPTVTDTVANALFYYGVVRSLADESRPLWSKMSFQTAQANFEECARNGLHARLYWPGSPDITVEELVLRELLPLAHSGLAAWGVAGPVREHYLQVIERRAVTGQNGASWQLAMMEHLNSRNLDRSAALRTMFHTYTTLMNSNQPVHTWPIEPMQIITLPPGETGITLPENPEELWVI